MPFCASSSFLFGGSWVSLITPIRSVPAFLVSIETCSTSLEGLTGTFLWMRYPLVPAIAATSTTATVLMMAVLAFLRSFFIACCLGKRRWNPGAASAPNPALSLLLPYIDCKKAAGLKFQQPF